MKLSKPTVQHILLVLLTMTSGCVDAISFLKLGQVFTAAMTGNTVLFGLAVAHTDNLAVPGFAVSLVGFMAGVAIGALILSRFPATPGWSTSVTICLCVEMIALILFAIVTGIEHPVDVTGSSFSYLLIAILAIAMGVQGVTARRVGVNGVTTTVITSTLTGLIETLVWKSVGVYRPKPNSSLTSSSTQRAPSATSISMWAIVIVFYGLGAAVCGKLITHWQFAAVWLPIAIVLVVVVIAVGMSMRAFSDVKTNIAS